MTDVMWAYRVTQVAWAVWFGSWLIAASWSSKAERRSRSILDLVHRLVIAAGAFLLFVQPRWRTGEAALWNRGAVIAWVCVGMTIAGLATTWWARITLGRLWSGAVTRKADHRVVADGPYRIVRHPIYFGLIVAVAGTSLMLATGAGFAGAALIAAGLVVKARVEERFLRRELGDAQYAAYARRVPMLLPFVW